MPESKITRVLRKEVIQRLVDINKGQDHQTNLEIWEDTAWSSLRSARAAYPDEKYRAIQIVPEKE